MLWQDKTNKSIRQINFMALLFAGLFVFIFACLIIANEYFAYQKEIERIEASYPSTLLTLGNSVEASHSLEVVLEHKHKEYKDKIIDFMVKIYALALVMYMISTIEYRYVNELMAREVRLIVASFKEAAQSYRFIDTEKMRFREFREIDRKSVV